MGWRLAEPGDLLRIVSDWFHVGRADFFDGKTSPWPHLAKVIDDARMNAKLVREPDVFGKPVWICGPMGSDAARKVLVAIYDRERHAEIKRSLEASRPLVVYDLDNPAMIVAWGHPEHCYVVNAFRGKGLEAELTKAISGLI